MVKNNIKNTKEEQKWSWLADPNAAFELHSIERRAFYKWQVAERNWSEATSHMDSGDHGRLTKAQRDNLEALKNRLDEAAQEYERARQHLHEAWSA